MTSHQDIHVRLCERGEFAELTVESHADPSGVTPETLAAAARAEGVAISDSVEKRLRQMVDAFQLQPRRICRVIATSTNPTHGVDGYLRWEPAFARVTKPMAKRSRGTTCPTRVNHYAGLHYVDVSAGDHVATIIEPTEGVDGVDVCGQPIKARPGQRCDVRVDPTLTVDEAGRVVSTREGTLQFERNVLRVADVLMVSGCVDFTTGNIKVNGSVDIKEHVRAMFTIHATGDVTVGGIVEAASIVCNRHFYCRRGVVAKGRGKLVVGGNAEVGYLNDVRGTIARNLVLRREAIDSDLAVNGDLRGEAATIIGGVLTIGGDTVIGTLGSGAGKPTIVEPRGSLRVLRMLHHGVTLRLPSKTDSTVIEAVLRDPVDGPVDLSTDADGQWCFVTAKKLVLPLAGVAVIQRRRAA